MTYPSRPNRLPSVAAETAEPGEPAGAGPRATDDLFAWSGGGIALLVERTGAGGTVARGWLAGDRLTDVRRWHFSEARPLGGQVRRLVAEASGDHVEAARVGAAARDWVTVNR